MIFLGTVSSTPHFKRSPVSWSVECLDSPGDSLLKSVLKAVLPRSPACVAIANVFRYVLYARAMCVYQCVYTVFSTSLHMRGSNNKYAACRETGSGFCLQNGRAQPCFDHFPLGSAWLLPQLGCLLHGLKCRISLTPKPLESERLCCHHLPPRPSRGEPQERKGTMG